MVKSHIRKKAGFIAFLASILLVHAPVFARTFTFDLVESSLELASGLTTRVWTYGGTVPGVAIRVNQGDTVVVDGYNRLPVTTNIHWHGLVVPNDQDGPTIAIKPGERFRFQFVAGESGTYWYHSHLRPVLEQMDMGLYGAFIVTAPEDAAYSIDETYILDDWLLDARGRRLQGTDRGGMERLGNIETVNGKTGTAIQPLTLKNGQLAKLRFINASTAAVHTLKVSGHSFRVTHLDGHALSEPFMTDTVRLGPGERIDAELSATGKAGNVYAISSDRPDYGMVIPIRYASGSVPAVESSFKPPKSRAFTGIDARAPDYVLELNSTMNMDGGMMHSNGSGGMMDGSMMHSGGSSGMRGDSMMNMMRWTINGKSWPDTAPLRVKVGTVVKVRFVNKDTMMHSMDHPMHLHGTYFQVLSENGRKPARETWKDTVNVPAGESVDIAFRYSNPGDWMLHCHIIDHEDNGLMTMIQAY